MYTIKTPSGFLGYTENPRSKIKTKQLVPPKSYIIGFKKLLIAKYVVDVIKVPPQISLTKENTYDITADVIENLESLGIDIDYKNIGNISIDTSAKLRIEKEEKQNSLQTIDYDQYNLSLKLVNMDDFVFMPFENNIGIIMPYDIEYEDTESIVLSSSIIDPCNSISQFRKTLRP